MMRFLILILYLSTDVSFWGISPGVCSSWKSGPPEGLPELSQLDVDCGKDEMIIHLLFSAPYDGSVYSKSNGQSPRCIHVPPHSHITEATFSIDYRRCGTRSDSHGKYYENTIVVQYDDVVIEAWDEAKKIRCEWHDGYEKSAYKTPITISDLDVVEMNFQGDDVDCWLEVQDGKGPWSAKVEGLVPLGSPLTLVVAIQDGESQFDMRVKSCIAHDGEKHPIHLTDEDGCVLRPKMMSPFRKTSETKGTASVIAYSHFYAFKFPETVEVTIQCTVEICRHGCPDTCTQGREAPTDSPIESYVAPPPAKDPEDIPTYKDSHPFSTVVTPKPKSLNFSVESNSSASVVPSDDSSNETNSEADPLKTSPDTKFDFYVDRFPPDLYDILEAEERQDNNEQDLYTDEEDSDYAVNRDNVYFSQEPNIFPDENEQGKQFPVNQKIQNVSIEERVESPNESLQLNNVEMRSANSDNNVNITSIDDSNEEEKGYATEKSIIKDEPNTETENSASKEAVIFKELKAHKNSPKSQVFDQNFTTEELFEEETTDIANLGKTENLQDETSTTQMKAESLQRSNLDSKNILLNQESNKYADDDGNKYEELQPYRHDKKNFDKKLTERSFEDFKIDNNEMRESLHDFSYRPFVPPQPPLTLYNGVPLYYYNQPKVNVDYYSGYRYEEREPYRDDYMKSKLRMPGKRRGRREIGENEQLGLKQTLRVIATTDLDFVIKENENVKPIIVNRKPVVGVCMANSSFAAGLGLLLLANVCVLCVVVFLGHHYRVHRKARVKNNELLCTEVPS